MQASTSASSFSAILLSLFLTGPATTVRASDGSKVVIPFDFVSRFDNGRYGAMIGDMIWKKLDRQQGFVLPESMMDVRDACARLGGRPSPETPLDRVGKIVQGELAAQIGIWGSVERVPGHEEDVYDLVIRCVDFSAAGGPKVVYQCSARTKVVSEIPHLYVKQMLDALYGRSPEAPAAPDLAAEENWRKNPNLVVGGDFESGAGNVPNGWEPVAGQKREPLGNLVRWIPEPGNPQNQLIRFTFPAIVGDNEGVMYYSRPFPVEEGGKYRFQCRWRTTGPAVKVFIKCYEVIGTEFRRDERSGYAASTPGGGLSPSQEFREVYRSQQNLSGPRKTWNTHTEDFTPRHTEHAPRWGRVMLYAYVGAGVVDFDDVVVRQLQPGSPSATVLKDRRHSSETKVTVKEMEENRRRMEGASRAK